MLYSPEHFDASATTTSISFDNPGQWGALGPGEGPALAIPPNLASVVLSDTLCVEFLYIGLGKKPQTPLEIDGAAYYAVRLMMDTADEEFPVHDDFDQEDGTFFSSGDEQLESGQDYHPGQLNVKFLRYQDPSNSRRHVLPFTILAQHLTLQNLIALATQANLRRFIFLPYKGLDPALTVWKGCRDFVLQFYLVLVQNQVIEERTPDGILMLEGVVEENADEYPDKQYQVVVEAIEWAMTKVAGPTRARRRAAEWMSP
ncbi:hypothetical protein C8R45DRAFT_921635 [Mycena sanguinolenta]|nr:hypothetical protein C8R45DRAFT_921635 [Mycena sanguinolenta]